MADPFALEPDGRMPFADSIERDLRRHTAEVHGVLDAYARQHARRAARRRALRWLTPLPLVSVVHRGS